MLNRALIVSSPTCEKDKTQAGLTYLATVLNKLGIQFEVLDLSGTIDYFDPPKEFFSPCDSKYWLSPRIFHEASWLDDYLPNYATEFDVILYSALFSPDILIQGRHAINQKKYHPNCVSIIGGVAISCLNSRQLSVIKEIFDYVCTGYDVDYLVTKVIEKIDKHETNSKDRHIKTRNPVRIQPNYELIETNPFVTVYSGHGCSWGKCRFCSDSSNLSNLRYYFRSPFEVAHDFEKISRSNSTIRDVMLSSDSFTQNDLLTLASCLKRRKLNLPYNIMLRGENWVSEKMGELLQESGCTDVFIGAEALNDGMLEILNKGLNTEIIIGAIKTLSKYVNVTIGLILFVPCVTEKELEDQLLNIEKILPNVLAIEPEILSVVQGTEFANQSQKYGIKLGATEKTINDSWCYGLSPEESFVEQHYWDSIDYVRLRF